MIGVLGKKEARRHQGLGEIRSLWSISDGF